MSIRIWLCILLPFIPAEKGPATHALYLSVVQIEHSKVGTAAKVLVKVFKDDLQDVIRAAYPEHYEPTGNDVFCENNKLLIERYFREKLNLQINGDPAGLDFLEGTQENDVYWLKFQIEGSRKWQDISIHASFFMEIFSTQSNIIQVINGQERRFARLTRNSQTADFNF